MGLMDQAAEPAEQQLLVHVVMNPQDDGMWAAIATDYSVVGAGESPEEAVGELTSLLVDYLNWCLQDGMSLAQARRPISKRWRVQLAARRSVRHLTKRVVGSRRAARPEPQERDVLVPAPAAC